MMTLLQTPLFWAMLTIAAFVLSQQAYLKLRKPVFLPPILLAIVILIAVLLLTHTDYAVYMEGGQYLHDMLGPLIVMLAVPLYQQLKHMKKHWLRIMLAVSCGSLTTVLVAWGMTIWLIGDPLISTTMVTKSITTPVAVAITNQIGGNASLASGFVIITGILGAVLIVPILKLLNMNQPATAGLSLGVCGHAIGTGRALELGETESAYAAMAMTLTATLHAILLPWLML